MARLHRKFTMLLPVLLSVGLLVGLVGCRDKTGPTTQLAIDPRTVNGQTHIPVDRDSGEMAAVAVYVLPGLGGQTPSGEPIETIVAIWPSGRILWSENPVTGGPPYHQATLAPAVVRQLVDQLIDAPLFLPPMRGALVVDVGDTVIAVHDANRCRERRSCHEILEKSSHTFVTDRGSEPLNGRTLEQALAGTSEPYRAFRREWMATREAIARLLPERGEPAPPNRLDWNWVTHRGGNVTSVAPYWAGRKKVAP